MSLSGLRIWSHQCHRLVCLLVALGVCLSCVPLPVGWLTAKDLSTPFPCQHRACGCRSADQCWKKCCCFTNTQKVAWANQHAVALPDSVLIAAKAEVLIAAKAECAVSTPAKSCCASKTVTATTMNQDEGHLEPSTRVEFVVTALVNQCQGQYWFWNALPWAVECPADAVIAGATTDPGESLESPDAWLTQLSYRPPVPPPRIS